jgi:hypothetical protein
VGHFWPWAEWSPAAFCSFSFSFLFSFSDFN